MDLTGNAPNAKYSFNLEATEESVFDPDYRSLADVNDYKDGGKYRCRHIHSLLSLPPPHPAPGFNLFPLCS